MEQEKPREKLARLGAEALKSEELLAIMLGTGYKGKNVFGLAREVLLNHTAEKFVRLTFKDLSQIKGIGFSKAASIKASFEFAKRCIEGASYPPLSKPLDVLPIVGDLCGKKKENFVVFFLNGRNQVISRETISVGTLNASLVHPREVFEPAIRSVAAGVILVHNHPSGDCTPSEDDIEITRRLSDAGKIIGIEVVDHIIVGGEGYISFKEKGLL
ncbi:MAG: DNA repair protein RadC [Elusimicrobiota bacterium]